MPNCMGDHQNLARLRSKARQVEDAQLKMAANKNSVLIET